jgi:prevent-host-death family protein
VAAYNIAEAKAHLSDLVERALRGESIAIMRRGKPLVQLTVIEQSAAKKPIDIEMLRALTAGMPMTSETVQQMRDEARY